MHAPHWAYAYPDGSHWSSACPNGSRRFGPLAQAPRGAAVGFRPPRVTAMYPRSGPAAGGLIVTLVGSDFGAAPEVSFGVAPAARVYVRAFGCALPVWVAPFDMCNVT